VIPISLRPVISYKIHLADICTLWAPSSCLFNTKTTTTTTTTAVLRPFVRDYPGEPVPEETFTHSHLFWSSVICFLNLLRSIASFLFSLRTWQSFCTTSFQVLFGLLLGKVPFTSYFFSQSLSYFRNAWPYQCNLFCCSTKTKTLKPKSRDHNVSLKNHNPGNETPPHPQIKKQRRKLQSCVSLVLAGLYSFMCSYSNVGVL